MASSIESAPMSSASRATPDVGSAPILAAFESFRGTIIDLDGRQTIGPAALARSRSRIVAVLRDRGVAAGARVVMAAANGPGFFGLLAALLEVGASPVLVHAKSPAAELRRTAHRCGARWIVSDEVPADDLAAIGLSAFGSEARGRCLAVAAVDPRDAAFDDGYPELLATPLHITSGTTGVPKVAVRPGRCALAEAEHYIATIGIDARDTILALTPMSHAYAYGMGVMVPLLSHAKVATSRAFDATRARRALVEQRVSILPAVPAMLDLLLFGGGSELCEARCVLSAGAPLPERTGRRFFDACGRHVRPLYGTTETGGITVAPDDGRMAEGGYVGPPMEGVAARLMSDGNATDDDHADIRHVAISSTSMMAGYLSHAGLDRSPIADGWFRTGDLGQLDAAGSIYLKGRESEVINVAGLKVLPCEVEDVIAAIPGIAEVKVYAGQDRNGRQFVKAAVVAADKNAADLVRSHCKADLVYFKQPRVVTVVDRLPRSASGKIVVSELP